MTLFKDKFKIDSNRLKNWDYSSPAVYFITLITHNRQYLFGSIEEGKMVLNENGHIVEKELLKSIKIRKSWFFHNWIDMPNHVHLLIEIQDNIDNVDTHIVETHSSAPTSSISTTNKTNNETNVAETHCCTSLRNNHEHNHSNKYECELSRKSKSISSFVAIFKSVTTKQINGVKSIWQSNYYDHIVRNYKRFEIIYNYIKTNPSSWETDSMKL